MENKENSPFLTTTYQNIFIMDLRQINECFFNKDYDGSFEALRILHSDLLDKPKKDIEEDWKKFLTEKNALTARGDLSFRRTANKQKILSQFLYINIPIIKAKFIQVLEENNLLKLETGAKPKYRKKGHLTAPI